MKRQTITINEHPLAPNRSFVLDYGNHLVTIDGEEELQRFLKHAPHQPDNIWEIKTSKYEIR